MADGCATVTRKAHRRNCVYLVYATRYHCHPLQVGQFNWVPEVLDVAGKDSYDTMESELHTALHEMVHVLGGMSPGYTGSTPFISNTTGAQRDGLATGVFVVEQDPVYQVSGKQRTLITTPRVVNFTRTYFDCPNATGFPLEDVPLVGC